MARPITGMPQGVAKQSSRTWILYHLPGARSSKIVWLLKELELQAEIVQFESLRDVRTRQGYETISPLRKIPVLVTQYGPMLESVAIQEFIISTNGKGRLRPAVDSPQLQKYLQWIHFAEPSLAAHISIYKRARAAQEQPGQDKVADHAAKQIRAGLAVIEAALTEHRQPYILGREFSAADISLVHGLRAAQGEGLLKDFPLTDAYMETLKARPMYQESYVPYPAPTS
ncbi:hypothetical protein WJX73_007943 [Symbiochloris irregularis]|uniref:Glutathione S-transferase n=1 Tax=Symbiochloris irregularis TaxID=706552 RepID=A0AAW1PJ63_9CHLO